MAKKSKEYRRAQYLKHKTKQSEQSKKQYALRKKIIDNLKDAPCADCNQKYPPCVMDFDHINGDKEYSIGNMWYKPMEAILKEITKCELVCSNCHRIRTYLKRK